LWQRLAVIQEAIDRIAKDKRNVQQGFDYVSSDAVLATIREAMCDQRLLLMVQIDDATLHLKSVGDKGWHMTELRLRFTWINSDSPEERIEVPFYGQGTDPHEKGVGKALTYAEKYFLLKQFHLPTDKEDPDAHEEGAPHGRAATPAAAAPAAAPRPAAPKPHVKLGTWAKRAGLSQEQVGALRAAVGLEHVAWKELTTEQCEKIMAQARGGNPEEPGLPEDEQAPWPEGA